MFSAKERALVTDAFFCRTSFMEHFRFYTNLKFNWENFKFHLCPNVAIFLKNVFIFKDRTLKKNNIERTRISRGGSDEKMWFGLEIDVVGLPPLVRESWLPAGRLSMML